MHFIVHLFYMQQNCVYILRQSDALSPDFMPRSCSSCLSYQRFSPLATIKTTIIFFVCPFKCLNKHCFYFLLGNWKQCISKILERQTKSIMVFLIVANCPSEQATTRILIQLRERQQQHISTRQYWNNSTTGYSSCAV